MEDVVPVVFCVLVFAMVAVLLFGFVQAHAERASLIIEYNSAVMGCILVSQGIEPVVSNATGSGMAVSLPVGGERVTCRG